MTQLDTVTTDKELDDALIGQTAKAAVLVNTRDFAEETMLLPLTNGRFEPFRATVKPVSAFLRYISKHSVPAGHHDAYRLEKKRGFSRTYTVTAEVRASVSVGIKAANASLEVSTGFESSESVSEETTEEWTKSVTGPADWWVYQPTLVYTMRFQLNAPLERLALPHKYQIDGWTYCLAPVHRNSPVAITHDIQVWSESDMYAYLYSVGFGRW